MIINLKTSESWVLPLLYNTAGAAMPGKAGLGLESFSSTGSLNSYKPKKFQNIFRISNASKTNVQNISRYGSI